MPELVCSSCQRSYPLDTRRWRCECGSPFDLAGTPPFTRDAVDSSVTSLWRYRAMLPIEDDNKIVSLGEGLTPLVPTNVYGLTIHFKLEFLAPTGSFKDRGTTVLVSALNEMGVDSVVEDSSGNAAASLAAYCAHAGIRARLFVPAYTSPAKKDQIAYYGAQVVSVEGPREKATQTAQRAARSTYYASHFYNPLGLTGAKTFAYEICEQLGWQAPDSIIFPAGHGTLLLGSYLGFSDLLRAEVIDRLPRLFAVQSADCSPLYQAFSRGLDQVLPVQAGETVAEGIRIVHPVRGPAVLQAVRDTGGSVVMVDDWEILRGRETLARQGFFVEPTSAVVVPALHKLDKVIKPGEITVLPLTGSGLKVPLEM